MPDPIALCLEDLDATTRAQQYLRCVALVGRQPGLRLTATGSVLWQTDDGAACEIWVSADDRLIVFRPLDAPPSVLRRAGRSLELPAGKPVVARNQDLLELGARRLRLHVHGVATKAVAPSPLPTRGRPSAARVAALVAVGAAVAGCERPVEIRQQPPEADPTPPPTVSIPAATGTSEAGSSTTTSTAPSSTAVPKEPDPIEVREDPPDMVEVD